MIRILSYFLGNIIGLLIAARYIPGFQISPDLPSLATLAVFLMLGNIIIRPILKLILAPLIWITLGLFTIIINAAILFAVDFTSDLITINGLDALLYGTLIISLSVGLTRLGLKLFIAEEPPSSQK